MCEWKFYPHRQIRELSLFEAIQPRVEIPACLEFVDTQLATTLGRVVDGQRVTIATVEHPWPP